MKTRVVERKKRVGIPKKRRIELNREFDGTNGTQWDTGKLPVNQADAELVAWLCHLNADPDLPHAGLIREPIERGGRWWNVAATAKDLLRRLAQGDRGRFGAMSDLRRFKLAWDSADCWRGEEYADAVFIPMGSP